MKKSDKIDDFIINFIFCFVSKKSHICLKFCFNEQKDYSARLNYCIINPKITSKNIKNISNIKPQLKEVIEYMHTGQTCKHFFQNNRRFSSLCNAILFSGEEVIKRDSLISYQNEETAIINQKMGITD